MTITRTAVYPLQVQFEDLDFGGVVHHPNYLKYLERARTALLQESNHRFSALIESGVAFAVAEVLARFLRPARPENQLYVLTRLAGMRRSSLKVYQAILDRPPTAEELTCPTPAFFASPEYLFVAQLRLVCVSVRDMRPQEVPEALRTVWGLSAEAASNDAKLPAEFKDVRLSLQWGM